MSESILRLLCMYERGDLACLSLPSFRDQHMLYSCCCCCWSYNAWYRYTIKHNMFNRSFQSSKYWVPDFDKYHLWERMARKQGCISTSSSLSYQYKKRGWEAIRHVVLLSWSSLLYTKHLRYVNLHVQLLFSSTELVKYQTYQSWLRLYMHEFSMSYNICDKTKYIVKDQYGLLEGDHCVLHKCLSLTWYILIHAGH